MGVSADAAHADTAISNLKRLVYRPRDNLSCQELIDKFEAELAAEDGKKASAKRKSEATPSAAGKKKKTEPEAPKVDGFKRGLIPDKIIGATDSSGELMFLLKW